MQKENVCVCVFVCVCVHACTYMGFPCGSTGKESASNAGDLGLIHGLGRSPGKGKGCPIQYFRLENSMDCIVHGVTKSHIHIGWNIQFGSVAQSCLTLCDPMDWSTPGFPVHHQFPELAQTHAHQVSDAIQPSHSLSPPSLPTFNLSQH